MNSLIEPADSFDRFLSAVKLLADAAEVAVDFDDFALCLEQADGNPLFAEDPGEYLYNMQNALEDGLTVIFQPTEEPKDDTR